MKHEAHTQHIMNNTDAFYIRNCTCGVIHLCFGPTTLNLTEHAVIAVTETLKEVCSDLLAKRALEEKFSELSSADNVIQGMFPTSQ